MNARSRAELTSGKCKPCEGGVQRYSRELALSQLIPLGEWTLSECGNVISRKLILKNFADAMKLLNCVAEIAQRDQHHPDIHLTGYRNVQIDLTTHAINGLSENDFILAAKIDVAVEAGDQ